MRSDQCLCSLLSCGDVRQPSYNPVYGQTDTDSQTETAVRSRLVYLASRGIELADGVTKVAIAALCRVVYTRSSAVAQRPRDASCY